MVAALLRDRLDREPTSLRLDPLRIRTGGGRNEMLEIRLPVEEDGDDAIAPLEVDLEPITLFQTRGPSASRYRASRSDTSSVSRH
jgi:hypothetical protein